MVGCKYFVSLVQIYFIIDFDFRQLNAHWYPVWASLSWHHLAIMTSSVSNEHKFSSAGITISKHHNQLKGDIVETLQHPLMTLMKKKMVLWKVILH
jgi:hypothetical protein